MTICDVINHSGLSFEELYKATEIPASTLSDILSGKAELTHCQARTIQKLSHGIGLSMDELMDLDSLARSLPERNGSGKLHKLCSPDVFRAFRGDLLDVLQHIDEETFIYAAAQTEFVESMYEAGLCPQALYSLGLIDYLCDKHRIPRLAQYNKYRGDTMEKTVFGYSGTECQLLDYMCFDNLIPQMLKFNFVETPESLKVY